MHNPDPSRTRCPSGNTMRQAESCHLYPTASLQSVVRLLLRGRCGSLGLSTQYPLHLGHYIRITFFGAAQAWRLHDKKKRMLCIASAASTGCHCSISMPSKTSMRPLRTLTGEVPEDDHAHLCAWRTFLRHDCCLCRSMYKKILPHSLCTHGLRTYIGGGGRRSGVGGAQRDFAQVSGLRHAMAAAS